MDKVEELNEIWHLLFFQLRKEMKEEEYSNIRGLSTIEISILHLIHDSPDIILKQICARLNIPKSTLTSIINRLVKKGFLERVINPNDKRAFNLRVTETGGAVEKEHIKLESSFLSKILDGLDSDESEVLLRLINKSVRRFSHEIKRRTLFHHKKARP